MNWMDWINGQRDKGTKRQRDKAIKDIILNTISLKNLNSLIIAIFKEEKKKKKKLK